MASTKRFVVEVTGEKLDGVTTEEMREAVSYHIGEFTDLEVEVTVTEEMPHLWYVAETVNHEDGDRLGVWITSEENEKAARERLEAMCLFEVLSIRPCREDEAPTRDEIEEVRANHGARR